MKAIESSFVDNGKVNGTVAGQPVQDARAGFDNGLVHRGVSICIADVGIDIV